MRDPGWERAVARIAGLASQPRDLVTQDGEYRPPPGMHLAVVGWRRPSRQPGRQPASDERWTHGI
jgi:hypothetical protein